MKRLALCAFALIQSTSLTCGRDWSRPPETPRRILIFTGTAGGVYRPLGEALVKIHNQRFTDVLAEARSTPGSVFNVKAVQNGEADVAFAMGDTAYLAHRDETSVGSSQPRPSLRALAALYSDVLQITTRRGGPIRRVADLAGRRVGVGPRGSGTEAVVPTVMEAHGIPLDRIDAQALDFDDAAEGIADGKLDAAFVMASYPAAAIASANQAVGIRLLSLEPAAATSILDHLPFYRPAVIPRGTYVGQDADVHTLEVDNVLVCRSDLDQRIAYRLAEILLESLPELAQIHPAARAIDLEQALNTPIPLHVGAARFYRKREILR